MTVTVTRFQPEEWQEYAESAHKLVFKKHRDPACDRISFALVTHDADRAMGYVTCREIDQESLYWQYGGCFDEYLGLLSYRCFDAVFKYSNERYKRITTLVQNDNVNYLHLLMKKGFRAIGIRFFGGDIMLEMFWGEQ